MTDAGEKLRDRIGSAIDRFLESKGCRNVDVFTALPCIEEAFRDELERAAGIADRFKQPWIGEDIRKLKE